MPLYQYHCDACGEDFTEMRRIAERHDPIDNDCPNCDSKGHISMRMNAPKLLYTVDNSLRTEDVFNDRLKEIKKNKGGSSISTIETR